jgi:hypothetical protein
MNLVFVVNGYYELDIDPEWATSVDEVERYAQEIFDFITKNRVKGLQVYLPAGERGALLEEIEKNNS